MSHTDTIYLCVELKKGAGRHVKELRIYLHEKYQFTLKKAYNPNFLPTVHNNNNKILFPLLISLLGHTT